MKSIVATDVDRLSRPTAARFWSVAAALLLLTGLATVSAGPLAGPVAAASGDWTQFQGGPNHQGYNATETALSAATVAGLGVSWTGAIDAAGVYNYPPSQPVVADGVVYVGTSDHKLKAYSTTCRHDGGPCTPLWTATIGGYAANAPAVDGGIVYVSSDKLYAFQVGCASGGGTCTPLWTATVPSPSAPTAAGGVVYVGGSDKLYAFTVGCGSGGAVCLPLWTAAVTPMGSPAVDNGKVFVGSGDKLYAFAAGCASEGGTCLPVWTGAVAGSITSGASVASGVVYVASDEFDSDTGEDNGHLYAFAANCATGGGTCSPIWDGLTGMEVPGSTPVVANGVVYVQDAYYGDLLAFAVGCSTGGGTCAPLWTAYVQTEGGIDSVAVANGVVYFGDQYGWFYAFSAGTAPSVPVFKLNLSCDYISAPAIANGVVYVGSCGKLYALGLNHGAVAQMVLSPAIGTIVPGGSQPYTAAGSDAFGNSLGNVTSAVTFTVGGGSCTANSCTATVPGDHVVTAVDGSAHATAGLHVFSLAAGDWPQFHNDATRQGVSTTEDILSASDLSSLGVAWTGGTGAAISSSPAVADGVVYVGAGRWLYAFAVGCAGGGGTCTPLWTGTVGYPNGFGIAGYAPAVANGVVYVGSNDDILYAFPTRCRTDGGTCAPLWTATTGGAINSSPAVANGVVYIGSGDGKLYAYAAGCRHDGGSCAPLWTGLTTTGEYASSPTVAGSVVYVGSQDGYVYAFGVGCRSDGGACSPIWKGSTGGFIQSAPAVADGTVYVSSDGSGFVYAFAVGCGSGGTTCSQRWQGYVGNLGQGHSSPAVSNGVVYVGSRNGKLYAYATGCASDGSSCDPVWTATTGGAITSSPAVANGVVYVGSEDHKLYAYAVGCASGGLTCTSIWSYTTGGAVRSSPAVANGVVYVGANDYKLYAFSLPPTTTLTVATANPFVAGSAHSLTVTAKDAGGHVAAGYRGTIHLTSSDPAAVLPADYTFTAADAGVHKFATGFTLKTAGTRSVTATDKAHAGIAGTQSGIVVTVGPAKTLTVSTANPWVAGAAHTVTVTARDAGGNTVPGYLGTIHFTSSDPVAVLPADYTFTGADNGVHSFSGGLTLKTAGSRSVTATDKTTASITGTQSGIIVTPGAAKTLTVSTATSFAAGTGHTVTITARDAYGNVATGYLGTVHLTSTDPAAVLPANYTFIGGDAGVHRLTITLKTAGSRSVTATDVAHATITGTQSGITVTPGAAKTLTVSTANPWVAGASHTVTITAKDAYGNTATSYLGTIHVTSSDLAAVLPADSAFLVTDAGVHHVVVKLKTAGSQWIRATDTVTATITGSVTITVT